MKDPEIIELIKRGSYNKSAGKLYAYYPVIEKYVITNNGRKEDAEDIFQEALIILFKKINDNSFTLSASLNTYVFAIAKNLWFEQLRIREKENISANALGALEKLTDEHYVTEEDIKIRKASEAVALLGAKCKELLLLFYYKKLSMVTIAKTLGYSGEKLAKNQKYRCLQKAKEIYLTLN